MPTDTDKPITIGDLHAALSKLVARGYRDAAVFYDGVDKPVGGGIIGQLQGHPALNLAPIKLDQVGGF